MCSEVVLNSGQGVRWVAAGGSHTVAVTDDAVFSWGQNSSGQLGLGHFKTQHHPAEILSLRSQKVSPIFLKTLILLVPLTLGAGFILCKRIAVVTL